MRGWTAESKGNTLIITLNESRTEGSKKREVGGREGGRERKRERERESERVAKGAVMGSLFRLVRLTKPSPGQHSLVTVTKHRE